MPIVIWAGQGRDSPLIYFQQKQKYKQVGSGLLCRQKQSSGLFLASLQAAELRRQWQRLFKAQEVTASGTERMRGGHAAYNLHFSKVPPYTLQLCEMLAATVLIFNFLIPVKLIGIKSLFALEHVINSTP